MQEISQDGLQIQIKNIDSNLERLENNSQRSFDEIKLIIKEWKDDYIAQNKSTNSRIDILYTFHEASKDDRRDIHRLIEGTASDTKVNAKDIQDLKTDMSIFKNTKTESGGFKKGLEVISKTITTIATVIVSLGIIATFSIGIFLYLTQHAAR